MNTILEIFSGVDLRNSHDGLRNWAERESKGRVRFGKIKPGQFLVFINSNRNAAKIMVSTGEGGSLGLVSHYRSPRGRIELTALKHLPGCFNGSDFDWNKATEKALQELFPQKKRKEEGNE